MIAEHRLAVVAPSEWDVVLSPELAPLFVLDAALVAAQRFFSILLDPSSSTPGGAGYPPTRALLATMMSLRRHIHEHRATAEVFHHDDGDEHDGDEHDATDDDIPDQETEDGLL